MLRQASNFVGDLRGIASTGVRAVRTRLELLGIELKEEKAWLVRFLVFAVASLYLLTFGLLLGISALVLFASEENRPAILGGFAALFVVAGGAGIAWLMSASKHRRPLLQDTIAILKGDEHALRHGLEATGD